MKKKLIFVLALLLSIVLVFLAVSKFAPKDNIDENKTVIATSFFPITVAVQNITDGVDDVVVKSLSQPSTGCLHDYQLTTNDMQLLSNADILFFNGAGMEGYMDSVDVSATMYFITDGIDLMESTHEHHHDHCEDEDCEEEHDHEHEDAEEEHDHEHEDAEEEHDHEHEDGEEEHDHDHDHEEVAYNSHAWVNPEKYIAQLKNITNALIECDEKNADKYTSNMNKYIEKIENEVISLKDSFKDLPNNKVVIFHESMAYLCEFLGLDVIHSLTIEGETTLSAAETAEIIEICKSNDIILLIGDNQYSDQIPSTISNETGIDFVTLNSNVNGELSNDAYLNDMKANINELLEMLK